MPFFEDGARKNKNKFSIAKILRRIEGEVFFCKKSKIEDYEKSCYYLHFFCDCLLEPFYHKDRNKTVDEYLKLDPLHCSPFDTDREIPADIEEFRPKFNQICDKYKEIRQKRKSPNYEQKYKDLAEFFDNFIKNNMTKSEKMLSLKSFEISCKELDLKLSAFLLYCEYLLLDLDRNQKSVNKKENGEFYLEESEMIKCLKIKMEECFFIPSNDINYDAYINSIVEIEEFFGKSIDEICGIFEDLEEISRKYLYIYIYI